LAKRGGEDAAGPRLRRASDVASAARPASTQTFARVAILATLLLLALYTYVAILRIEREPQISNLSRTGLLGRADTLAARIDIEASALRGGVLAAREALRGGAASPLDAADAGLRTTAKAATAVGVVADDGLAAISGPAPVGLDWAQAARAAARSGKDVWLGVVGVDAPLLVAAAGVQTPRGRRWIVAVADPHRLADHLDADRQELLTSAQGRVLAAAGGGGLTQARTLNEGFAINPEDLLVDRPVRGERPDGKTVDLAARATAGGAVLAVAATPAARSELASRIERQLWVLAPFVAALLLGLLLLVQSRKVEVAQRAFMDSERRFRLAVEAARCGIWEWDLATDQMFMSDVTGAILGWGGGGVVDGQDVLDRVAPDHRDRLRQALATAATYGAFDVSFRSLSPEGARPTWIDARGQAFGANRDGGFSRIIGVALDVTEERLAQARAQAAENRLRDAIESVSEAFVLWNRQGRLLMCNRNYATFFSLDPTLLKPGAPRQEVLRLAQLAVKQEIAPGEGGKGVREAELNDGRWVQISERRTSDGGLVMTAADITAIKVQEEARRLNEIQLQSAVFGLERSQEQLSELARKYEAEKVRAETANKAKSEFLANMSHELRTPLNAINGFSEIMVGEMFGALGDARYKEYAQDILNSGQHLLALINDILDMSKIEAGKMNLRFEPIALEDVAEDAIRLVRNRAEAAGLALSLELPEMPDLEADYRALKQVLLNLLSNAIKFTPRGGRIVVSAEMRYDVLGERVRVNVQDTGIGIGPDEITRLARPFEQIENQHSKTQQGTGLGLALTKSLVEMHGGTLDIQSAPGQGTTVSFLLPARQTPAAVAGSIAAA